MSKNDNRGIIGVGGLAVGIGCGLYELFKLLFGVACLCSDHDGGHAKHIAEDKKAWWKSLSAEDKKAYKLHEQQKNDYIKLRERFYHEVRRRCYKEFRVKCPPDSGARYLRQCAIANQAWEEWKMADWNFVQSFVDWETDTKHRVKCPEGGTLDTYEFLPRAPVWTPPKWR